MDGVARSNAPAGPSGKRHDTELASLLRTPAADSHEHGDEGEEGHGGHESLKQLAYRYRLLLGGAAIVIITAVLVATLVPLNERRHGDQEELYAGMDEELVTGLGPSWWPINPTTSGSANSHFLVGLRMLHVFWYDQAAKEFQRAIAADPGYAMGYWGVAMSCKQQLWMTEDPERAEAALEQMDKRARMGEVTTRDKPYINAVRLMWGRNQTMEQRERAYNSAMQRLYERSPDDVDACAFYALSLLSMTASTAGYLPPEEIEEVMGRVRETLRVCSVRWWDHTGLLHYTTHAYDEPDPAVARQGLAAGEHLSEVATAACHAQHMKSHLFLQLGNWSEVVDSNYRAVAASDYFCNKWEAHNGTTLRACDKDDRYHALEWWIYGLTQQCAWSDAHALLGRMTEISTFLNVTPFDQWALRSWAHVVMQSHASPDIPPLVAPAPLGSPLLQPHQVLMSLVAQVNTSHPLPADTDIYWELHARASALTAAAYALTLHTNSSGLASDNGLTVQVAHARMQNAMDMLRASVPEDMPFLKIMLNTYNLQLEALQVVSSCLQTNATTCQGWFLKMDQAVDLEIRAWGRGPSLQIAPAMEMYGHLLLLTRQLPDKATAMFTNCLDKLPNRQSCVLGMARAASASGDTSQANQWYARLWAQCAPWAAPPDFLWPGLVEAYWMLTPPASRSQPPPATKGAATGVLPATRSFFYSYAGVYTYVPVPNKYAPPANVYNDAMSARAAPYPPPADLDPVNKLALTPTGYRYPYQGVLLASSVPGYPSGKVALNVTTGAYQYVTQGYTGVHSSDYWPPSNRLYTDKLRAADERRRGLREHFGGETQRAPGGLSMLAQLIQQHAAKVRRLVVGEGTAGQDELRRDRLV